MNDGQAPYFWDRMKGQQRSYNLPPVLNTKATNDEGYAPSQKFLLELPVYNRPGRRSPKGVPGVYPNCSSRSEVWRGKWGTVFEHFDAYLNKSDHFEWQTDGRTDGRTRIRIPVNINDGISSPESKEK